MFDVPDMGYTRQSGFIDVPDTGKMHLSMIQNDGVMIRILLVRSIGHDGLIDRTCLIDLPDTLV